MTIGDLEHLEQMYTRWYEIMNEEALFQEYSTNRALQATYPDFATYRDFICSQDASTSK